jgi:4-alpha-glucanotransferase
MERKCGVLLPISSLSSPYGIGCFSEEAYRFVDFLEKAGQSYWQILPLGQTGYGDSPYQSVSTFAGNPYFIDLCQLIEKGYLSKEEVDARDFGSDSMYVDYEKQYQNRYELLRIAYQRSPYSDLGEKKLSEAELKERQNFQDFIIQNRFWLEDYALYCAIKEANEKKSYAEWQDKLRLRNTRALHQIGEKLAEEIRFYQFLQYLFEEQYMKLKKYANEKGIEIIGDMPIYVAEDSADVWSHPELFDLDKDLKPHAVAGCPPDGFSPTGQLWGNPLYDWDYHKKTGYKWWISRIEHAFHLYDVVRIDHFRGFDAYYTIPYGNETAEKGSWMDGPGYALFETVEKALGKRKIIAEDLGFLTDSVYELVEKTGYPGMKVLQFAFDESESSEYLPYQYPRNCVVYTGTHDNETLYGWYSHTNGHEREFVNNYAMIGHEMGACWQMIRCIFGSVADTAIVPLQDYLNLDNHARINQPSTLGGQNWKWRMNKGQMSDELARDMQILARTYGRAPKNKSLIRED